MAILFTHKRLHVGYRARDWSDVWYEYIGEPGEDDEPDIGLYSLTTGKAQQREPMEGEVLWHPALDPANCESKIAKERRRLQCQFLYDAYRYLAEKDHQKVLDLEEELDQPNFSRWREWFKHAKKYKRAKTQQRSGTRKRRTDEAMEATGLSEGQFEVNSDTSDDSAYESARDSRVKTPKGGLRKKPKTPRRQYPGGTPFTPKKSNSGRFTGRGTLSDYSISGGRGSSINGDRNADSDEDMDTHNPFSTQGSASDRVGPENGDGANKPEHGNEE